MNVAMNVALEHERASKAITSKAITSKAIIGERV